MSHISQTAQINWILKQKTQNNFFFRKLTFKKIFKKNKKF